MKKRLITKPVDTSKRLNNTNRKSPKKSKNSRKLKNNALNSKKSKDKLNINNDNYAEFYKFSSKLSKILYKKKLLVLLAVLLIFLTIVFFDMIKFALILGGLLVANILLSYAAKSIPRYNTALELIIFSTVLCGINYGAKVGALVGFTFSILYYYAANRMSIYIIIFAPLYAIFGLIAGIVAVNNVFVFGMICVLLYSIISSFIVSILFNAHIDKAIGFIFINTIFNLVMFKYMAPILMLLM